MKKKEKDILRIIKATRDTNMTLKAVDNLMTNANIPSEVGEKIKDILFSKKNIDDLNARITNMYDELFTAKEIKELADFYESPIGTKFIDVFPTITVKTVNIGQEWGYKIYLESEVEINKIINSYVVQRHNISLDEFERGMEDHEKQQRALVESKLDIIKEYVSNKGWDINNLTEKQLVEIAIFITNNE